MTANQRGKDGNPHAEHDPSSSAVTRDGQPVHDEGPGGAAYRVVE